MIEGFKTQLRTMLLFLIVVDAIILTVVMHVSHYVYFGQWINIIDYYTGASLFTLFVCLSSFYIFDLYELSAGVRRSDYAVRFLVAVFIAASVLPLVFYSLPAWRFRRGTLLYTVLLFSSISLLWRVLFEGYIIRAIGDIRIALVGTGDLSDELYEILAETPGYHIETRLNEIESDTAASLLDMSRKRIIDAIAIDLASARRSGCLHVLLECKMLKVDVYNMGDMYESMTGKVPVMELDESRLVSEQFRGMRRNVYMSRLKRLLDIGLAATGLIITLPVSLVAAILVKGTSSGPVFFRQERVGLNWRVFEILKFRSMRKDAEINGAVWASEDDPRITAVGRLLRVTRVDEIPQMWNVLKGDMSFIGPRPERPVFVDSLNKRIPFYSLRHIVKPGITGWAQINYRYGASEEDALEKLQYDLFYIKNLGIMIDLQILFKTVKVILFGSGAR